MSMFLKKKLFLFLIVFYFFLPLISLNAQTGIGSTGLEETAKSAGLRTQGKLPEIIGDIINWGLGLLGTVFLLIVLVGGYKWMMAAGNEEKISKAKAMIGGGISGIIILFLAYALAGSIIQALSDATQTGG